MKIINNILKVYNIVIISVIGFIGLFIYRIFKNNPDSLIYKVVAGTGANIGKSITSLGYFLYDDQIGLLGGRGYDNIENAPAQQKLANDLKNSRPRASRLEPRLSALYPPLSLVAQEFIKKQDLIRSKYKLEFYYRLFEVERTKEQALINQQKGTGIANSMHIKQADDYVYAFDFVPFYKGQWTWYENIELKNSDAFLYSMLDLYYTVNKREPKNRGELTIFAYDPNFRQYNENNTIITRNFLTFVRDIKNMADSLGFNGSLLVRPRTDLVHTELNYKNKYKFAPNIKNQLKTGQGGRIAGGI